MKVTVYGSHLCPDTLYAINQLKTNDVDMSFKNIIPQLFRTSRSSWQSVRTIPSSTMPRRTAVWESPALFWRTAPAPWIFPK